VESLRKELDTRKKNKDHNKDHVGSIGNNEASHVAGVVPSSAVVAKYEANL
jgi:hypothetical protein